VFLALESDLLGSHAFNAIMLKLGFLKLLIAPLKCNFLDFQPALY